ncbi:mannitol dehydrogenase family protein [Pseudoruegeria sp. HB172150]|uniref:mannitol dehydrogenase family protein n=1 Tax=Pseudoruegeria sp. HB172150 TaxID=2721164 RepID=UPI001C12EC4F|nr:mannitol dehydrogenase family protein [Pseudoruegeria sp. HB172150]
MPAPIATPSYDRAAVRRGILHIGLGNFHRAHQAIYLDDLLNRGLAQDWALVGAGVMSGDAAMREDLAAQDNLFTVVEQDAAGDNVRIVGAMVDFLAVEDGHAPLRAAMEDPAIRIVSLTVTEGGYYVSAETGTFDPSHPAIQADIANQGAPQTVFGVIVAGLRARRAAGVAPFTVMSCDNVPHNGDVCRAAVMGIAEPQDAELAGWIAENVAFPNGMVDRITPATTPARQAYLAQEFDLQDARPVFCEPFRQWVLEDRFTAGRPPFEEVGVQFVPDVTPYEHMKIRILNGGHAIIAYSGGLMGIEYAHEAMQNDLVSRFLAKVETEEIIPIVPPVPDTSLTEYFELIRDRFSNPRVEDTIRRLCLDGSNRQPKFIVPSIADNLKAGKPVPGLALESALWCRYCYGTDENGAEIAPNDPSWDRLTAQAKRAKDEPDAWLEMGDIYGSTARDPAFRESFTAALKALWRDGTETVLRAYLDG